MKRNKCEIISKQVLPLSIFLFTTLGFIPIIQPIFADGEPASPVGGGESTASRVPTIPAAPPETPPPVSPSSSGEANRFISSSGTPAGPLTPAPPEPAPRRAPRRAPKPAIVQINGIYYDEDGLMTNFLDREVPAYDDRNSIPVPEKYQKDGKFGHPALNRAGTPGAPIVSQGPQGRIDLTYPDGTIKEIYPDGSGKTFYPDGSTEIRYRNGHREIKFPSHKVIIRPDGYTTTQWNSGRVEIRNPQGNIIKIIEPNGQVREYEDR